MGRNQVPVAITILMLIDSLEMAEKYLEEIVQLCLRCDEDKLIIKHGTDTMTETAGVLAKMVPHKTIVLTGAMIPIKFGSSDGLEEVFKKKRFGAQAGFSHS